MTLKGKTILITGASSGLGKAIALLAAEQGAEVILMSRSEKKLSKVYDRICHGAWPTPIMIPLDFTKATSDSIEQVYHFLAQQKIRLHGLIHCAADHKTLTPLVHYDAQQWYHLLQLHLNVPVFLTSALLPLMQSPHPGAIIFTDHRSAHNKAYFGAYGVAKSSLANYSSMLHQELSSQACNPKVHLINPPTLRTRLRAKMYPGEAPGQNALPHLVALQYLALLSNPNKVSEHYLNLETAC